MTAKPKPRVAELGPTLAWSADGGGEPPITHHQGREVVWCEWEIEMWSTLTFHVTANCGKCGWDGQRWIAWGVVNPQPGERFVATVDRVTKHRHVYGKEIDCPARPVRRLIAFRCPACKHLDVYDRGIDGKVFESVEVYRPTLFDEVAQ